MSEYSTEQIRELVGLGWFTHDAPPGRDPHEVFDRWLAEHDRAVAAKVLRDAAQSMQTHKQPGHWNLADELDPANASQSPDLWLELRAQRIEAEHE